MTTYSAGSFAGSGNVTKAGKTQPTPQGSEGSSRPAGGAIPAVVGKDTPTVTKAGPTQK